MSRATSSTRSVIITKSLCPRIVLACCASCTRMESSSPTLKLCGKEHSHCTPWAQRTVDPKLSLPKIQLLDFLYGEWGEKREPERCSSSGSLGVIIPTMTIILHRQRRSRRLSHRRCVG